MPLFYFLAGLFHDETKSILSHVWHKAMALLLPCVLAFAGWLLIQAIIIPDTLFAILKDLSFNALYGTGKTLFWGQLWFLTSLFVTTCFCHLLIRSHIVKHPVVRGTIAFLLIPIGTWFLVWSTMKTTYVDSFFINNRYYFTIQEGLPWNLDLLPITAAFYLMGTIFPKWKIGNQPSKSSEYFLWGGIAFLMVGVGGIFLDWGMDLNNRHYDHWAGSTFVALCGIGGIFLLSLAFDNLSRKWPSKALSFIGKHSLFILILHFSFQQNSFGKMLSAGVPWLVAAIISFAVGLGVSLVAALAWERVKKKRTLRRKIAP